jgi:glutamine amidotransferase
VITIIDYKAGNLASVQKALTHLGYESIITEDAAAVAAAERLLLPGVGNFVATERLNERGLTAAIRDAIARGVPFMGICVGMQWLFEGSTEAPGTKGLGLFPGMVERFRTESPAWPGLKVPHVGWNTLDTGAPSKLLAGLEPGSFVYFTHSYRAPLVDGTVAMTTYGERFSAAVERGNVFGTQFHPEKSSHAGLRMLKNFCEYVPAGGKGLSC